MSFANLQSKLKDLYLFIFIYLFWHMCFQKWLSDFCVSRDEAIETPPTWPTSFL
jgi:hypothetical protein